MQTRQARSITGHLPPHSLHGPNPSIKRKSRSGSRKTHAAKKVAHRSPSPKPTAAHHHRSRSPVAHHRSASPAAHHRSASPAVHRRSASRSHSPAVHHHAKAAHKHANGAHAHPQPAGKNAPLSPRHVGPTANAFNAVMAIALKKASESAE
ncbi:Uncharacterized protein PBTT_03409 [Plasmodiophora brassicae]